MFLLYFFSIIIFNDNIEVIRGNDQEWSDGMVTFATLETFEGEISYKQNTNVLFCRVDNTVRAFPAHKVKGFNIYDPTTKSHKFFVTQNFSDGKEKKRKVFMEVVLLGEIPVYRKPYFTKGMEDFKYYALIGNEYVHLTKFKKNIMPFLNNNYSIKIKKFIKDENINVNKLMDQIRLISFYNSSAISGDQVKVKFPAYKMNQ